MSSGKNPLRALQEPGVSHYVVISLAALFAMFLVLTQRNFGTLALFPVAVGLLGVVTGWSTAPVMVLLTVAGCLHVQNQYIRGFAGPRHLWLTDLLLCAAVLAYAMAQYRLQGLRGSIFPLDRRRREGPKRWQVGFPPRFEKEVFRQRRSPALVSSREIGWFVASLPIWVVSAQVFWNSFPSNWGNPGLPISFWRTLLMAWFIGLAIFMTSAILNYWKWRRMTLEEATLALQDVAWKETRLEQRRQNRWLAWARLKKQRKEKR